MEWCDSTTPLLSQLINTFDDSKSQAVLLKTLDDGYQKMATARAEIGNNFLNLNRVDGAIDGTLVLIAADFDHRTVEFQNENREFYENFKYKVKHLDNGVSNFKLQLKFELRDITDMRVHTELVKEYLSFVDIPELRDAILKSAEGLHAECASYRKKHQ